jgi:hypothetical protein
MCDHCECDPCQHGKARAEDCVFCQRYPSGEVTFEQIAQIQDETIIIQTVEDVFNDER